MKVASLTSDFGAEFICSYTLENKVFRVPSEKVTIYSPTSGLLASKFYRPLLNKYQMLWLQDLSDDVYTCLSVHLY